jgi:hypothetical protein
MAMRWSTSAGRGRARRSARRLASLVAVGGLATVALVPAAARAQLAPSEVELEDMIAVVVIDRDLIAYDLGGTATPTVRLDIGEEVSWYRASGRVGMVMTDERVLAVSPGTGGWKAVRFGVHESAPSRGLIAKRVALVVTSRRILGFDSRSGAFIVQELGPNEEALHAKVGASTAVVVTNRTAYGLSPAVGSFYGQPMAIHERLEAVRIEDNVATLETSQRLLVFRAPTGIWTVQRRSIH